LLLLWVVGLKLVSIPWKRDKKKPRLELTKREKVYYLISYMIQ
jgi:hypothetical protein